MALMVASGRNDLVSTDHIMLTWSGAKAEGKGESVSGESGMTGPKNHLPKDAILLEEVARPRH